MQNLAIDVAFSGLLMILFGVVTWVKPDDRAKSWLAGWICVVASYGVRFALFSDRPPARLIEWLSFAALTMAGAFFTVSTTVLSRGRRFAVTLWAGATVPTLLCLALLTLDVRNRQILLAAVVVRQVVLGGVALSTRIDRSRIGVLLLGISVFGLAMAYGIFQGQPRLVIAVMLAEVYCAAGTDIWNQTVARTSGMYVTSIGLFAWGLLLPMAELFGKISPGISSESGLWSLPRPCVAVGMILIVVEEEIRHTRALAEDYRLVFESNPHPLWIFDVESLRFLSVNEAACTAHGYTKEEFLQLTLPEILDPEFREIAQRQARKSDPVPNRASRHIRKDGRVFPMDITAHSVIFEGKRCRFVLGLDVTKRDNLERRLQHQLTHDPLTGLVNRLEFEHQIVDAVARSVQSGEKLAVICFDIHHFKHLNEVYGPRIGDICIQYVATILAARVRPTDFVARTGDDEFAIVLTGMKDAGPAEQMTTYLKKSFSLPAIILDYEVQITYNLGLAICPDDGMEGMALWHLAESALRRARGTGGNVVWLSPALRSDAEKKTELAASMSRTLEDGGFYLVYQPLYGFDGAVESLEALLRLQHPRYGAVDPVLLISIAEETGLIEPLGQWVLEEVCRQQRTWMERGARMVPVGVNVSLLQIMRAGFADRMAATLAGQSVAPKWIDVELTETAAMDKLKEVSGEMAILSSLGCTFSIDDFGTGHSSLARLHQLPISRLKIDRSFIEQLSATAHGTSFTIVEAIISMAHALHLRVIAEGVETEEQLSCLRALSCDILQGFLLSKPVLPNEIPALLAAKHPLLEEASLAPVEPWHGSIQSACGRMHARPLRNVAGTIND